MEKPFFLKVTAADYVRDYILQLTFNDGAVKLVDFASDLPQNRCMNVGLLCLDVINEAIICLIDEALLHNGERKTRR